MVPLRAKRSPKAAPACEVCGSTAHRWDEGHTTCPECGDAVDLVGNEMQPCRSCARAARIREHAEAIGLAGTLVPAQPALTSSAPAVGLSALFEEWKREVGTVVSAEWWKTRSYHFQHIAGHFGTLDALTDDALHQSFKNARLTKCSRETHKKERGTLTAFFDWVETKPWGFARPGLPKLGKKDRGTRDPNRKRAEVPLSEAEAESLIAHLPAHTRKRRHASDPFRPIRDPVLVEWDTGLRPSTIERLRVPEHWQAERPNELFIAANIDKEEYERTLPLTPRLSELFQRRAAALARGRRATLRALPVGPAWTLVRRCKGSGNRRAARQEDKRLRLPPRGR